MATTTFTSCMHDQMLESNRDDVKLEAMRCVTVMTAKGKLSVPRTLFPHIVKNVSSKNPELKKLIYLYLTNFADQEPDLALLPVATLQKSLKSPNPLVRSSALKVLTSMRLNILSAILMATLRNSVNDLSPYVRKTVAHSIIKIYRLDPSLKPDLVEYIERLFNDKNSMVLSSVVAAFEIVCPERLDMVQKHYRRFCFILADCNEWGQTVMLKLLVRFVLNDCTIASDNLNGSVDQDPKILLRSAKPLVHSNNSSVVMAVVKLFIAIANPNEVRSTITRPLIRLLYSHREIQMVVLNMIEDLTSLSNVHVINRAPIPKKKQEPIIKTKVCIRIKVVALSIIHLIPRARFDFTSQPLQVNRSSLRKALYNKANATLKMRKQRRSAYLRASAKLRARRKVAESSEPVERLSELDTKESDERLGSEDDLQMSSETFREIFRPYIKSFLVKHSDCTQIRLIKLKILTNLSSSVNVSLILRELQAYIAIYVEDKEFVSAAIHAIGRCAIIVKEVAHTCLLGLTTLLSNNNEHIVSEAIVVLRSQIINKKIKGNIENGVSDKKLIPNGDDKGLSDEEEDNDDDKMVSAVIKQVTKLMPTVTAPQARATILWILAEFCDKNLTAAKCVPNVLRLIAKSFGQEDNLVKLQSLTLVVKFILSLDKEKKADLYNIMKRLASYLFSLAKYDINHDVRDRGRFLKKLLDDEKLCFRILNAPINKV